MKRRITIIALALAMVLTMSASAFAGTNITNITITQKPWPEKVEIGTQAAPGSISQDKYTTDPEGVNLAYCYYGWLVALTDVEINGLISKGAEQYIYEYDGCKWAGVQILYAYKIGDMNFQKGRRYGLMLEVQQSNDGDYILPTEKSAISVIVDGMTIPDSKKYIICKSESTILDARINLGTLQEDGTFTGGDFSPETTETKQAGADTSDTNDIALFSILGILALCGAGFVYKRREN